MPFESEIRDVAGVPNYKILEFQPKTSKYLVCVFVINEGERIERQLRKMKHLAEVIDVVIADGGSTDGSLSPELLTETSVRTLLSKQGGGKLSAQMRMAFHYALTEGYLGVIIVDGNGKDGIEAIPNFVDLLDDGYDHIQGSRYIPGGHHENTPISRTLALKLIHAPLISIASRTKQTDTTNGFRAYSATLIGDPEVAVFRDVFQSYELHYHLAIEAGRQSKFKTTETPVSRVYPARGRVPTKISPIRGNSAVLSILLKSVTGKYRLEER